LVSNVTASTQHEQDGLPPRAGSALVAKQARADHPNRVNILVPDDIHSLSATAREPGRHDLGRIHVGVGTGTGVLDNPLNGLVHGACVGRASAVGCTLSNGEEPIAGDLLQKSRVRSSDIAAGAVAPDKHRELGGACVLGRVVDRVVPEGAVRLPSGGSERALATTLLLIMLELLTCAGSV
jgi:hypothetical protein